jgi:hypothetical protein
MHRVAWAFLVAGLLILTGGGYLAVRTAGFLSRAEAVPGTVIDLKASRSNDSTTYAPVVRFTSADGDERTFVSKTSTSPPMFSVGEAVEVLYDPADAHDSRIHSFGSLWGGEIGVSGLGLVFGGVGAAMLLSRWVTERQASALRQRGRRLVTRFQAVERNLSLTVNGRSPWRIVTQWLDPRTGKVHVFSSQNLWFDPTPYVDRKEITVFVDPVNLKRHHVDVSFLPELVE